MDDTRPERVTLNVDLFEAIMGVLEQLPLGQVRDLDAAVRADVRPLDVPTETTP